MKITFTPDKNNSKPIYIQLTLSICADIDSGLIPAEAMLPSTRDLCESLGVSRDTVVKCYRELKRLSYVDSDSTRNTYVRANAKRNQTPEQQSPGELKEAMVSEFTRSLLREKVRHANSSQFAGLNFGSVPRNHLPIHRWRELMQSLCVPETFRKLEYEPDVLGRIELRQALTKYLHRTKGIQAAEGQLAIFSISAGVLTLLCKLLLSPGSAVAVEEPGYGGIRNIAKSQGAMLIPIPIDDQGMRIDILKQYSGLVRIVYVTPGHHDPSGVIMSTRRRQELIEWATANNVWVIEDDYDGNFYYAGQPPGALWSMAPDTNVIYVSTFWQLLYPLTTISYCLVPTALLPALTAAKELQTESHPEHMVQLILARLLSDGYLERYIRRNKMAFARRRIAFITELTSQMRTLVKVSKVSAGNYFVVTINHPDQQKVLMAAEKVALPLVPTAPYYLHSPVVGEYLLNFTLVPEERIREKVTQFSNLLRLKP
ncbi:MAG: PLP-dependent aminotransferase family protein [Candidatus Obscuribacterales bacterium]|jgi:GntR family transcriptional regulator/MocR family aminotransferase